MNFSNAEIFVLAIQLTTALLALVVTGMCVHAKRRERIKPPSR